VIHGKEEEARRLQVVQKEKLEAQASKNAQTNQVLTFRVPPVCCRR